MPFPAQIVLPIAVRRRALHRPAIRTEAQFYFSKAVRGAAPLIDALQRVAQLRIAPRIAARRYASRRNAWRCTVFDFVSAAHSRS
jgi:hypothetical protein